jgi:multiple sugar transport system permease protein
MAATPLPAAATAARAGPPSRAGWSTVVLLAPACVLFALFVVYPIVGSLRISLYDWNGADAMRWVGLGNYRELFADPMFGTALANNLRWLACYLLAPVLGLSLALLVNQPIRGMGVVRPLFFMPFVVSQVVVGLVFAWFFNARFGLFNGLLAAFGLPPAAPLDSETSIYAMIVAGLWPQTAYCMILYMTGLATLPGDVVDAGRVDGARGFTLLRRVVLPELAPVNFIVAMVCAVAALRSFDYVMIMTGGGPFGSSTVLAFYMYEQTFVALRYGYGAAIATVLFALVAVIIVALLLRMFRQEGDAR